MTLRIIGGLYKGRTLKTPKTNSTRPTQGVVREALFNICQNEIEGAHFLDLFAGSGAIGFEALSRGAAHVTFIEHNRQALQCIKENLALLQVESQAKVLPTDASKALAILTKQQALFDLIYLDPPYDMPFDLALLVPLLKSNGTIFLEDRKPPKQEFEGLRLKNSRKFGIAILSIFEPA